MYASYYPTTTVDNLINGQEYRTNMVIEYIFIITSIANTIALYIIATRPATVTSLIDNARKVITERKTPGSIVSPSTRHRDSLNDL